MDETNETMIERQKRKINKSYISKNTSMNSTYRKKTLRANNRALARALSKKKLELSVFKKNFVLLQNENQFLKSHLNGNLINISYFNEEKLKMFKNTLNGEIFKLSQICQNLLNLSKEFNIDHHEMNKMFADYNENPSSHSKPSILTTYTTINDINKQSDFTNANVINLISKNNFTNEDHLVNKRIVPKPMRVSRTFDVKEMDNVNMATMNDDINADRIDPNIDFNDDNDCIIHQKKLSIIPEISESELTFIREDEFSWKENHCDRSTLNPDDQQQAINFNSTYCLSVEKSPAEKFINIMDSNYSKESNKPEVNMNTIENICNNETKIFLDQSFIPDSCHRLPKQRKIFKNNEDNVGDKLDSENHTEINKIGVERNNCKDLNGTESMLVDERFKENLLSKIQYTSYIQKPGNVRFNLKKQLGEDSKFKSFISKSSTSQIKCINEQAMTGTSSNNLDNGTCSDDNICSKKNSSLFSIYDLSLDDSSTINVTMETDNNNNIKKRKTKNNSFKKIESYNNNYLKRSKPAKNVRGKRCTSDVIKSLNNIGDIDDNEYVDTDDDDNICHDHEFNSNGIMLRLGNGKRTRKRNRSKSVRYDDDVSCGGHSNNEVEQINGEASNLTLESNEEIFNFETNKDITSQSLPQIDVNQLVYNDNVESRNNYSNMSGNENVIKKKIQKINDCIDKMQSMDCIDSYNNLTKAEVIDKCSKTKKKKMDSNLSKQSDNPKNNLETSSNHHCSDTMISDLSEELDNSSAFYPTVQLVDIGSLLRLNESDISSESDIFLSENHLEIKQTSSTQEECQSLKKSPLEKDNPTPHTTSNTNGLLNQHDNDSSKNIKIKEIKALKRLENLKTVINSKESEVKDSTALTNLDSTMENNNDENILNNICSNNYVGSKSCQVDNDVCVNDINKKKKINRTSSIVSLRSSSESRLSGEFRSGRRSKVISYKEPALNTKLRRVDSHNSNVCDRNGKPMKK